ncbi:32463_t:CDS:2, partial [Gigaspora margarita]
MSRTKQVKKKQVTKVVRRNQTSYSVEQKKVVVSYAREYGRNKVAKNFNLDSSMVGRWMKVSESWTTETNDKSKRLGSGRSAFFPEAERRLYTWVLEQRKQALAVTYMTLQYKISEILQQPDMILLYGDLAENFKASYCWVGAFMKRNNLALQHCTKTSQKLPEQTQLLLEKFYQFIDDLRCEKSFKLSNIFNMDEMPVWYDMAGNITVNPKGEKTVHIRSTGNEKNRFTVVLICAAGKKLNREEQVPGIVIWHQENDPAMLVFDSFRGHLEELVKSKFCKCGFDLAVIPGGLTSICQPLDIAINKPFKDNMRKEWHIWMSKGGAGKTAKGNLRRARISDVCTWVKNSWENISDEIISKSFVTCGIVNNSSESDDDLEIIDL